jgi:hypothetical protein
MNYEAADYQEMIPELGNGVMVRRAAFQTKAGGGLKDAENFPREALTPDGTMQTKAQRAEFRRKGPKPSAKMLAGGPTRRRDRHHQTQGDTTWSSGSASLRAGDTTWGSGFTQAEDPWHKWKSCHGEGRSWTSDQANRGLGLRGQAGQSRDVDRLAKLP